MSVVRDNIMNEPGYTPYCGAESCRLHWPRTQYLDGQFRCGCGWHSTFEPEFIAEYEAKYRRPVQRRSSIGSAILLAALAGAMPRLSLGPMPMGRRDSGNAPLRRPEDVPNELGYTPRQLAEDENRDRDAQAKRQRRRERNLRNLERMKK